MPPPICWYHPQLQGQAGDPAPPPEEWIRAEGTHDPIISQEDFDLVARLLLLDTRSTLGGKAVYPLSGLLYCGDCRSSMARKPMTIGGQTYQYYICGGHKRDAAQCSTHTVRAGELEQAVLDGINFHIRSVTELREALEAINQRPSQKLEVSKLNQRMETLQRELEKARDTKDSLYRRYALGEVELEDFQQFKRVFEKDCQKAEQAIATHRAQMDAILNSGDPASPWIKYFEQFLWLLRLSLSRAILPQSAAVPPVAAPPHCLPSGSDISLCSLSLFLPNLLEKAFQLFPFVPYLSHAPNSTTSTQLCHYYFNAYGGEARKGYVGGVLTQFFPTDFVVKVVHLRRRAAVVPQDGGADDVVVFVQRHQTVHLAARADARHLGSLKGCQQLGHTVQHCPLPVLRGLLRPSRTGEGEGIFLGNHLNSARNRPPAHASADNVCPRAPAAWGPCPVPASRRVSP